MNLEILQEIQECSRQIFSDWEGGIGTSDCHAPIRGVLFVHGIEWNEIGETWQEFCRTAVSNGIAAATE